MVKAAYKVDRGVAIPKARIHPNPWNPNKMTDRQQQAVSESIGAYGQVLELLVRPHPEIGGEYQIIDGEHRFSVLPEIVYCNVIHDLPEPDAKKLTVILNETRGDADKVELAHLLADLQADFGEDLITGLPYSSVDLDELVKLADIDWDQFSQNEGSSEGGKDASDDGWTTILVKIPDEAMDVVNQAADLVKDQRDGHLHKDKAISWGQILESLAADFLAS